MGVGARRGVSAGEITELIASVLATEGLPLDRIAALATIASRATEPGLLGAAERLGVPLRGYPASALAAVDVPTPSATTLAAVGTPGVAEAAALLAAGPAAELLVPKRVSTPRTGPPHATCAVATGRGGPGTGSAEAPSRRDAPAGNTTPTHPGPEPPPRGSPPGRAPRPGPGTDPAERDAGDVWGSRPTPQRPGASRVGRTSQSGGASSPGGGECHPRPRGDPARDGVPARPGEPGVDDRAAAANPPRTGSGALLSRGAGSLSNVSGANRPPSHPRSP